MKWHLEALFILVWCLQSRMNINWLLDWFRLMIEGVPLLWGCVGLWQLRLCLGNPVICTLTESNGVRLTTQIYTVHPRRLTARPRKVTETQKERIVFQPSIFRGFYSLLNFAGVTILGLFHSHQLTIFTLFKCLSPQSRCYGVAVTFLRLPPGITALPQWKA